jgi:acyl carrier protein
MIEDKVKKIIARILNIDLNKIIPEASFVDDFEADSLDIVELIMSMEEEFDIDISDETAEKIITVKDAIDCIRLDDFDNLHIEIDNAVAELNLNKWDALEIWHMGVEQWQDQQTEKKRVKELNRGRPVF